MNAWVDKNNLILGQMRTDCKSNEITAIPKLLDLLFLEKREYFQTNDID